MMDTHLNSTLENLLAHGASRVPFPAPSIDED